MPEGKTESKAEKSGKEGEKLNFELPNFQKEKKRKRKRKKKKTEPNFRAIAILKERKRGIWGERGGKRGKRRVCESVCECVSVCSIWFTGTVILSKREERDPSLKLSYLISRHHHHHHQRHERNQRDERDERDERHPCPPLASSVSSPWKERSPWTWISWTSSSLFSLKVHQPLLLSLFLLLFNRSGEQRAKSSYWFRCCCNRVCNPENTSKTEIAHSEFRKANRFFFFLLLILH